MFTVVLENNNHISEGMTKFLNDIKTPHHILNNLKSLSDASIIGWLKKAHNIIIESYFLDKEQLLHLAEKIVNLPPLTIFLVDGDHWLSVFNEPTVDPDFFLHWTEEEKVRFLTAVKKIKNQHTLYSISFEEDSISIPANGNNTLDKQGPPVH